MGVCFKGYTEIAKLLINNGAAVNQPNYNDATALIYASTFGHTDIVSYLLKNKADKSLLDNRGNTALKHAQMQGNIEIIALLK